MAFLLPVWISHQHELVYTVCVVGCNRDLKNVCADQPTLLASLFGSNQDCNLCLE